MTLTLPEEAFLDRVDWHIECNEPECEQPADWWLICLKCRHHTPVCDGHKQQAELVFAVVMFGRVVCPECDASVPLEAWRTLFQFVPVTP